MIYLFIFAVVRPIHTARQNSISGVRPLLSTEQNFDTNGNADADGRDLPFADFGELLDKFSDILDLHIYYLYKYHSWVGPDNGLQRLMNAAVTREEFESDLARAADSYCLMHLSDPERQELTEIRSTFIDRVRATGSAGRILPVIRLIDSFSLDGFQLFTVLTLLCCETSGKYEKLFAYIQDDLSRGRPTAETAIRLFGEPLDRVSNYFGDFSENSVFMRYLLTSDGSGIGSAVLRLSPQIFTFLTENGRTESRHSYWCRSSGLHALYADREIAEYVRNTVKLSAEDKTALVFFSGKRGSGKRFQVKHCAAALGEDVLFADIREICSGEDMESAFHAAVCESVLKDCALCFTGFEYLLGKEDQEKLFRFVSLMKRSCAWLGNRLYITSEKKWLDARLEGEMVKIDAELPEPDEGSRSALWKAFMDGRSFADGIDPQEMAAKFRFTAGQIRAAVERAADLTQMSGESVISAQLLHESCYAQAVAGLDTLAVPIKAAYGWQDLVLPEREIGILKEACTHVRYHHKVYGTWGFGKKAVYGRGLSVLFSGPPGTGKTMAAQVMTNQLHMKMYKIQLSQVVSKYIGETEKNLRQVFTEARDANCILFFDEMEALFAKRSEVKDSHDRNANIETAYLLQQMEEYDGVLLMATNLMENIDQAFLRRINFAVAFPFPDASTRKLLWEKMLDTGAPIGEDVDYGFLAENFRMAGGNIKNCVIHAAFLAAAENVPISMGHLIRSIVNEQHKNNAVVLREDLKEYADLVFGD